jgi:hypothetical protein
VRPPVPFQASESAWDAFAWADWTPDGDYMVSPSKKKRLKRETFVRLSTAKAKAAPTVGPADAVQSVARTVTAPPTPEAVATAGQQVRAAAPRRLKRGAQKVKQGATLAGQGLLALDRALGRGVSAAIDAVGSLLKGGKALAARTLVTRRLANLLTKAFSPLEGVKVKQAQKFGVVRRRMRRSFVQGMTTLVGKYATDLFQSKFRANARKLGGGFKGYALATAIELTVGVADYLVRQGVKYAWQGAGLAAGGAIGGALGGPAGAVAGASLGLTVGSGVRMGVHSLLPKMNPTGWVRGTFNKLVMNPVTGRNANPSAVRLAKRQGTQAVLGDVPGNREYLSPRAEGRAVLGATRQLRRAGVRRVRFNPKLPLTAPKNAAFLAAVRQHLPPETQDRIDRATAYHRTLAARKQRGSAVPTAPTPEGEALKAAIRRQRGGVFSEGGNVRRDDLADVLAGAADLFRSLGKPVPPEPVLLRAVAGTTAMMA